MNILQSATDLAKNLYASVQKQATPVTKAVSQTAGNINNAGNVVQSAIHNAIQQVTNTGNNVSQGINNVGRFMQSPQSINIPQVPSFVNKAVQIPTPLGSFQPIQLARDIINQPVSTIANALSDKVQNIGRGLTGQQPIQYQNLKSPSERLNYNIRGIQNTPQQVIGNVAGAGAGALSIVGPGGLVGVGTHAVENAAGQTLLNTIKQSLLSGAGIGGAQGLLQGLANGRTSTLPKQLLQGLTEGAQGALAGGAIGGALGAAGHTFGALRNKLSEILVQNHGISQEEANKAVTQFARDEWGKFSGTQKKTPAELKMGAKQFVAEKTGKSINEPLYYSDLRNALGLPDKGNYEGGFVNFGVKVGEKEKAIQPEIPLPKQAEKIENPTDPYFNVNRINVSTPQKQILKQTVEEVKPQIEKVVGKKLSNQEIIQQANGTAKLLTKAVGRDKTSAFETSLLQTRQKLSDMAKTGKVDQEYIDTLITLKSHATDIARKLQSFSINAEPGTVKVQHELIQKALDKAQDSAKVIEAAKGVDFNDPKQATEFYRKFVKASAGDWLDTLRYNSMLSSPNTHINNAFSNFGNTAVVAPIEKTIAGGIDFLHATFTGKSRTMFAGEGGAFAKGYYSNLANASKAFANVVKGTAELTNLDLKNIPLATKGAGGAIYKTLAIPSKLLDASDQFFQALTKAGETSALEYRAGKGVKVGNIPAQAEKNAQYRLYREMPSGGNKNQGGKYQNPQGVVLASIDNVTNTINRLRSNENPVTSWIAKFTFPFVSTPMNLLKQGIEYSPAGVITLPGHADKTTQLAKIAMGTTAASLGALLASSGRLSASQPTSPKDLAAYKQAGLQPWSVKIGNNWVAYDKLPPVIGYPMAITASLYDAYKNKTISDTDMQTILSGLGQATKFFSDQSYVKNLGDIVNLTNGTLNAKSQLASNYVQQTIPFRAFTGWIARLLDPYQRQMDPGEGWVQKQVDLLKQQYPGLREQVATLNDSQGNPLPAKEPIANALSPVKISPENSQARQVYEKTLESQKANREAKQITSNDPQMQALDALKGEQEKQVVTLYTKLKALPKDEANAQYYSMAQANPALAAELKSYATAQKQLNDFSYEEKVSHALPITGGSRALYIYKKTQGMQTREEKNAYIKNLTDKGIVTPRILKQLQAIIANNGQIPNH